jgi:hypothetical protein
LRSCSPPPLPPMTEDQTDYLPIAGHGLIGDLHRCTLAGSDETIDWEDLAVLPRGQTQVEHGPISADQRQAVSASLLLAVAIGAFTTSKLVFLKEVGVGVAAAVLIDAFIVRARRR